MYMGFFDFCTVKVDSQNITGYLSLKLNSGLVHLHFHLFTVVSKRSSSGQPMSPRIFHKATIIQAILLIV